MKLVKLKVLFLSHSFLPASPIREYWTITHNHIPPATLSGILLRAVLFSVNPRGVYGDYVPCGAGRGLLVRVSEQGADWTVVGREEVVEGFRPPYLEYHFRAVVLGAYDEDTVRGRPPRWGHVEKFWNNLKYVDLREENLLAPFKVGIKTWHFAAMDGTWRHMTYDVVRVRFDIPPLNIYGFALVDDDTLLKHLEALFMGWFIDKTRLKTLVAAKVEEVIERATSSVSARSVYVVPSPRRPRRPSYMFMSALLSKEALRGSRRDLSVEKAVLYTEKPGDADLREKMLFAGKDGSLYAVDMSWAEYLELAGGGRG